MAFYSNLGLGPRSVAKLIADNDRVLHIGADNGNIAQGLVNKGFGPKNLSICDYDQNKFQALCARFPGYPIYWQDAMHLQYMLPSRSFDTIVSSIPPVAFREHELNYFKVLIKPGGQFLQITNKLAQPFSSVEGDLVSYVPLNILPMHVWKIGF